MNRDAIGIYSGLIKRKDDKILDLMNPDLSMLNDNEIIIFHGGNVYEITNQIKKFNLKEPLKKAIMNTKYFVGVSAGTVLLSKNSFLTKESSEIRFNHIHEDIAGVGIFDFGLNCHLDMLLKDEVFLKNFKESYPKFNDDFYMMFDGDYIKVQNNKVEKIGNIITRENFNR